MQSFPLSVWEGEKRIRRKQKKNGKWTRSIQFQAHVIKQSNKWNKTVKDTNKRKTVSKMPGFLLPTGTNGTLWKWIRNKKNDKMSERNKTVTWCRDTIIHNHSSQWNSVFSIIIIIPNKMQWQWLRYNIYNESQMFATTFTYKPLESLVDYYYYPGSNFAILWYVRVLCTVRNG